jgi:hypothetical protein
MITDDERTEIRRKIIDRLLPNANHMDRFRYVHGSHDEVLWYGLNGLNQEDQPNVVLGTGVQ